MTKTEYLLICLAEECAELQKEVSKALRFGLDDTWKDETTTAEKLVHEFHDVVAVYTLLGEEGIFPKVSTQTLIRAKKLRIEKYMAYSQGRRILEKPDEKPTPRQSGRYPWPCGDQDPNQIVVQKPLTKKDLKRIKKYIKGMKRYGPGTI